MANLPNVLLNNGVEIPQFGLGVFQIEPKDTVEAVTKALEIGYRHIDTAQMYGNEKEVGAAIAQSGINRSEIFVTSKLNNNKHGYDDALAAFDQTLTDLSLDRIDLFLVHWPLPTVGSYVETWTAMEAIYATGRARSIGVSNFQPQHLRRLHEETTVPPAVNQIELHPYLTQDELRAFDAEHGIATEAWSPIAQGKVLDDPAVTALATTYGKSPAQVVLRWHIQLGAVPLPKSATPSRQRENLNVFGFTLCDAEVAAITVLARADGRLCGDDPDTHEET